MTDIWLGIKATAIGKIGAFLIGSAPVILAVEVGNHVDALIAAGPPTLAIIVGVVALLRGQRELHVMVNSRMDEFLKLTAKASHAEGKEEERGEEQNRKDAQTP